MILFSFVGSIILSTSSQATLQSLKIVSLRMSTREASKSDEPSIGANPIEASTGVGEGRAIEAGKGGWTEVAKMALAMASGAGSARASLEPAPIIRAFLFLGRDVLNLAKSLGLISETTQYRLERKGKNEENRRATLNSSLGSTWLSLVLERGLSDWSFPRGETLKSLRILKCPSSSVSNLRAWRIEAFSQLQLNKF